MKEYIDFNTRLRTAAKNDSEKDSYKLMNNSVFGKTMENIRRHRDIKLVNNKEDYLKQAMKPNFKSGCLLGTDLMSCEMGKVKVKMNKLVYLGQVILDLSKMIMYEVIGLMKDKLGGKIMKEFIILRPKMKSYRVEESEPKKCKGIKKCVVKKTISFEDYKRCLFGGVTIHRSQLLFRSKKQSQNVRGKQTSFKKRRRQES